MATVDGEQLNIERMDVDRYDEQSVRLSNGMIFRCKYDLCSNTSSITMHSPDGAVMGSLQAPETGNFVRAGLEMIEDVLNSHVSIEDQRDRALARSANAGEALQSLAVLV